MKVFLLACLLMLSGVFSQSAPAQTPVPLQREIIRLRSRTKQLESEVKTLSETKPERNWPQNEGLAAFVSGAFCALWAQNTRRSAWLWFFCGNDFQRISAADSAL
ncbi:hypothetical protein B1R32_10878 [Abditibacterium utsteinense]|uniref:Uncharacterized protein n=1 Tax=Abditibacterium utsteinense TaxID=1960156 RepID=A0A2S8SSU4_9BACT|nr:hypothetical protein [Abditibacterium utsteinense]PQV63871.1 hypothetical protein B1R32_10878 [Abditibacterium utsteinense]